MCALHFYRNCNEKCRQRKFKNSEFHHIWLDCSKSFILICSDSVKTSEATESAKKPMKPDPTTRFVRNSLTLIFEPMKIYIIEHSIWWMLSKAAGQNSIILSAFLNRYCRLSILWKTKYLLRCKIVYKNKIKGLSFHGFELSVFSFKFHRNKTWLGHVIVAAYTISPNVNRER